MRDVFLQEKNYGQFSNILILKMLIIYQEKQLENLLQDMDDQFQLKKLIK